MLIVGSAALYAQGLCLRKPNDVDIICTFEELNKWHDENQPVVSHPMSRKKHFARTSDGTIYEFELAWEKSSAAFLLFLCKNHSNLTVDVDGQTCASLNLCYALKKSHKFLKNNPHFKKTMDDIITMEKMGATIPHTLGMWFNERKRETYNYSHPSLKQGKKDFFGGDGVKYVYDHDSIHEAIKIGDMPAYMYFKGDTEEVFCDRTKFEKLPYQIQLSSVLEESYVLAIERSLLHFDTTPREAFEMALEKVCTSITSGWWRDFAYANYYQALNQYDNNYYNTFKEAVKEGRVKGF